MTRSRERSPTDAGSWPHWSALAAWFAGLTLLAVAWWRIGSAVLTTPDHAPNPNPDPTPDTESGPAPDTKPDRRPQTRWLIGTGALWALPLLLAPPMASRDVYSYACQGHLFANGLNPYEAGVATLP